MIHLPAAPATRTDIDLIGFPMDLGADRRGVDMGPSALRIACIHDRLQQLGYKMIIYPAQALFLSIHAIQHMLADLKATGAIEPWLQQMIDFQEWKRVSGVLESDALERRYTRD